MTKEDQIVKEAYLSLPKEYKSKVFFSIYHGDMKKKYDPFIAAQTKQSRYRIWFVPSNLKKDTLINKNSVQKTIKNLVDHFENSKHCENSLDRQLSQISDSPFCSQCGHVTVRSASCYKCLNCGNSEGCS